MSNGNGNGANLSKKSKLTLSGILAALVGSGGYFVNQIGDEVQFLHSNAIRHEAQTASLRVDVDELKAEIAQMRQFLVDKLEIRIPEQ